MSVAVPSSWYLPRLMVHNCREKAAARRPCDASVWHGYCAVAEGGKLESVRTMTFVSIAKGIIEEPGFYGCEC